MMLGRNLSLNIIMDEVIAEMFFHNLEFWWTSFISEYHL